MHDVMSAQCPGVLLQALAARGEPLLSGFETAPADFAAYWRPHGWAVTELLDGRCEGSMLACEVCGSYGLCRSPVISTHLWLP